MSYSVQNIRNVCLLGHGGSGKTALTESLLYMTGAIDRMGKATDGNTVCDYDPEEVKRQISISTAVAPLEYKGCKINVLDAPGGFDFAGEVMEALTVADAAIIVCSAKAGMSVGAEKAWKLCEQRRLPRLLYISKTDEENSDYNATFDALRERFGNKIAPLVVPIWDENKRVTGIIDVLNKRAYEMQNGKRVEIEIPEGKDEVITEFNDALKESVAETSEEFMDKFFSGEDFTYVEMIQGLRQGVRELSLFPVFCGSAVNTMGSLMLMDHIVDLLPNPSEGNMRKGTAPDGTKEEFAVAPGGVPCAFVFKTVSDQYGKYSFVKVLSGSVTADTALVNARTGSAEKMGRLYMMRGKKAEEVKELSCGDIGAIGKMEKVKTGDTLCDEKHPVILESMVFPEPVIRVAIEPKTKAGQEKMGIALAKLAEEDPTFKAYTDEETGQTIIAGMGELHLEIIVDRLLREFKVEANVGKPQVAYKETIRGTADVDNKYARQSGGKGQYGHVKIRIEPNPGKGYEFVNAIVGGAIPKEYIPAVDQGIQGAMLSGVLAGYNVVDVKVTLYDGSYHEVDSSEMAFKIAASMAFKEAMRKAQPVLMEPIMKVAVIVPEEYMGDVIGDLNSRRGMIQGMDALPGAQRINAMVPLSEMFGYATDMRSKTQGRGQYTMEPSDYAEVPKSVGEKIISSRTKKAE